MAIYRFTARDGARLPDLQISEHDTLVEARHEAIRVLNRIAEVEACDPSREWAIDVADADGLMLFTLTVSFSDTPALRSLSPGSGATRA